MESRQRNAKLDSIWLVLFLTWTDGREWIKNLQTFSRKTLILGGGLILKRQERSLLSMLSLVWYYRHAPAAVWTCSSIQPPKPETTSHEDTSSFFRSTNTGPPSIWTYNSSSIICNSFITSRNWKCLKLAEYGPRVRQLLLLQEHPYWLQKKQ